MNIKHLYYNFIYGIQNLYKYFNLIWNDRDWDWAYLYQLMEFKLQEMAKLERKYGHHETSIEDAERMEECCRLLRRLVDDTYLIDYSPDFEKGFFEEKADRELLFRIMCDHSKEWWD